MKFMSKEKIRIIIDKFKDTEKPSKLEWMIIITTILFCTVFILYGDITATIDESIMLIESITKGRVFDFFQYCIENKSTSWAPTYEIPIFFIFAIWNFPLYILKNNFGINFLDHSILLLWGKLEIILFVAGSTYLIYKICRQINIERNKSLWAVFLFCTSINVIICSVMVAQVDTVSVFFSLLGIYYYIKNDNNKFILWFCVAITVKLFAIFIFIPLILLKEKRILKIIQYSLSGLVLLIISKLLFINNEGYKICMGEFSDMTINRVQFPTIESGMIGVPIFITIFVLICIYCYQKKIKSQQELDKFAIYVPFVVYQFMFMFIGCYWYWYILVCPYIIIVIIQNMEKFKLNILLEMISGVSVAVIYAGIYPWILNAHSIDWMPMAKIFGERDAASRQFNNLGELLVALGVDKYYHFFSAIFFGCIIAFIIINFPRKANMEFTRDGKEIERGLLVLRMLTIVPVIIGLLVCYYSEKPQVIIDTTKTGYKPMDVRILSSNVVQKITFSDDYELEKMEIMFFKEDTTLTDYASVVVEIKEGDNKKVIYRNRVGINTLDNEKILSLNLKKLNVKKNKEYEICISGMDDDGKEVYLAVTKESMFGKSSLLYENKKSENESLYVKFTGKDKNNIRKGHEETFNSFNSIIKNVKINNNMMAEIEVLNTGQSIWNENNNIRLHIIDENNEVQRGYIMQQHNILPGETYKFIVNLQKNKKYKLVMAQEGINYFGQQQEIDMSSYVVED